jgi:hypothetical protein
MRIESNKGNRARGRYREMQPNAQVMERRGRGVAGEVDGTTRREESRGGVTAGASKCCCSQSVAFSSPAPSSSSLPARDDTTARGAVDGVEALPRAEVAMLMSWLPHAFMS